MRRWLLRKLMLPGEEPRRPVVASGPQVESVATVIEVFSTDRFGDIEALEAAASGIDDFEDVGVRSWSELLLALQADLGWELVKVEARGGMMIDPERETALDFRSIFPCTTAATAEAAGRLWLTEMLRNKCEIESTIAVLYIDVEGMPCVVRFERPGS